MLRGPALTGEIWLPGRENELLRRSQAAVEQERADQRFNYVAYDILALASAILASLFSEFHERGDPKLASDLRASFAVDERIVPTRQIALRFLGIALVKGSSDHHSEHAVAKEL